MRNKIMLGIFAVVFVAFMAGAYMLYNQLKAGTPVVTPPPAATAPAKSKAADITVTAQNGKAVSLSDFLGRPVVVNFWASWCPPCKEEMPHFDKLAKEYSDVVFMMVDLTDGSRETKEKAMAFVQENGYTFNVYFDLDSSAADTYRIQSIPTSVFVDKEGNISAKKIGGMTENSLKSEIEKIR